MPETYLLSYETSCTGAGTEHRTIVMIPAGSTISLIAPVQNESEFVEVAWNGQRLRMFAYDFAERAEPESPEESNTMAAPAGADSDKDEKSVSVTNDGFVKVRRFNAAGREL